MHLKKIIHLQIQRLWFIPLITSLIMLAYESFKQFIWPDITIWESHIITIIFTTILATAASHISIHTFKNLIHRMDVALVEQQKAQLRAQEKEEHFQIFIEQSLMGVCISDMNGITFANKAFLDMMGYNSLEDMLGLQLTDLFHTNKIGNQNLKKLFIADDRKSVSFDVEIKHNLNEIRVVRLVSSCLKIENNNSRLTYVVDISDRINAEKALRESEKRFHLMFEENRDAIFWINPIDGTILNCNKASEKLIGLSKSELIGKNQYLLHPPEQVNLAKETFKNHQNNPVGISELVILRSNGEQRWVSISITTVTINERSMIQATFQDITNRKNVETALSESEDRFSTFMDFLPAMVFIKNEKGEYLFTNAYMNSVLGSESWKGTRAEEHFSEEIAIKLTNDDELVRISNSPIIIETAIPDKFGKISIYETHKFPIRQDGKNSLLGAISIDITERKRVDRQLNEYRTRLEDLVAERTSELTKTNEDLLMSRNFMSILIDAIPVRLFWKDLDCKYLGCNQLFALDAKLDNAEQIIGKVDKDLLWADFAEQYTSDDKQVMASGIPKFNYEEPQHKDGKEMWVRTSKVPLRNAYGRIIGVLGTYEDITDAKRAEELIRQSEEKFRTVADFTYDWEYWVDPNKNFVYISPSATRITEYSIDEFYANNNLIAQIIHPDDRQKFIDHENNEMTDRAEMDLRIITKNGKIRWVSHVCQPVTNSAGTFLGIRASNRDITDAKQLYLDLKISQERFLQLANNIDEIFLIVDAITYEFIYVNNAYFKLLGLNQNAIGDNSLYTLPYYSNEDREKVLSAFQAIVENKSGSMFVEYRIVKSSEEEIRWIRTTGWPVVSSIGKVERLVAITIDITEYKRAAERERTQREQLMQADKMASLGILVSGVAHEINNPNNLIMLNADILFLAWKDAAIVLDTWFAQHPDYKLNNIPYSIMQNEVPVLLRGIQEGSSRIRNIVSELKDFIRSDSGKINSKISVVRVIAGAVSIVSNLIRKSTVSFTIKYDENIPYIRGNFQQIEQVIINLLSNACQALRSKNESIQIRVENVHEQGMVRILVKDEGCGISAQNINKIMDPFFTTKRDTGGTGLGLSVSYSIIQSHAGRLYFDSIEGKGTTAIIELPEYSDENIGEVSKTEIVMD